MFVWDHLPFHQYHAAMPMWTEYSDVSRESSQQVAFGLNVIIMCCVPIVPYTRTLLHDMFENLSESPHTFCSLATCVQQGWAGVSNTEEESKTTLQHYPLNILHFLSQSFISKICQHLHLQDLYNIYTKIMHSISFIFDLLSNE